MPRLSVFVIALNQEANIAECLESVKFADEIVVVDTGSADRTVELARAHTGRVLTAPWQGFGPTKNFALDQTRGDWVFSLDTDERVPEALRDEILAVVAADGPINGYRVPRKNYFCRRWIRHLGWYPDYTLRLFRRGQGRFGDRQVHEEVKVAGPVGTLKSPLEHYSYRSVGEYVSRMDRYARLAALELAKRGRRPFPGELFYRPFFTFLHLYFIRRGFLEGATGYDLAVLMSMYKFLKYYYLRELAQGREVDAH
ncbi:MAG: glycosyltransferase family 2 protein [Syntrophobacterales bacterium]|jgi:glycosyltransferase involved in cell wall biosynthesis|nr:glycosyltransferase family 2 protein [Syntrophobacterales bacterium]